MEDLDSRNGTLVNGHPVRKALLEHDDEIRIGEVLFKVVCSHASGYAEHPLAGLAPGYGLSADEFRA